MLVPSARAGGDKDTAPPEAGTGEYGSKADPQTGVNDHRPMIATKATARQDLDLTPR